MLRINKASEYGVLALNFIGTQPEAASAREVSAGLGLPYEITAKTLQRLKEAGFIESHMGTNGGYKLRNSLAEISIAQVIDALEGPLAIIECATHQTKECSRTGSCGLQSGMQKINDRIRDVLESVKLNELLETERAHGPALPQAAGEQKLK
jgi:Rrf2 family protein